jgi:hypothetical protein
MIKEIRTYNAKLHTPVGEYILIDVDDIFGGSLYAIVTDVETYGKDEQDVRFHKSPYAIIVSDGWQIEFTDDVPDTIYVWVDKDKVEFEGGGLSLRDILDMLELSV